jgi:NADH-quinone oxidoreductase subunit N
MVPLAAVPYNAMIFLSFLMMLVGLAFKVGLAPFHFWVPDVYQGAPTSVTTFMSCVVKVAAFAALLKVLVLGFTYPQPWSFGALWVLAVLAMTLGNLAALQQRSIKRMLAYSSVAQAGYMLVGIVSTEYGSDGVAATLFYLVSYCAMTVGSFAVLAAVGPDADGVDSIQGLGKRSPLLAGCLTVFFLGLAGLPPSMAGLTSKLFVFSEALSAGLYGLAIIAVLNSALACAYYFRIPVAAFFQSAPAQQTQPISVPLTTALALVLCAAAVVLIGLFPEPIAWLVRRGRREGLFRGLLSLPTQILEGCFAVSCKVLGCNA